MLIWAKRRILGLTPGNNLLPHNGKEVRAYAWTSFCLLETRDSRRGVGSRKVRKRAKARRALWGHTEDTKDTVFLFLAKCAEGKGAQSFMGSHRTHRLTQNFYFAPLSFTLRMADASVTCVLCEFCVFCVRIKICPYVLLSQKLCDLLYSASFAWYETTLCGPIKLCAPTPSRPLRETICSAVKNLAPPYAQQRFGRFSAKMSYKK